MDPINSRIRITDSDLKSNFFGSRILGSGSLCNLARIRITTGSQDSTVMIGSWIRPRILGSDDDYRIWDPTSDPGICSSLVLTPDQQLFWNKHKTKILLHYWSKNSFFSNEPLETLIFFTLEIIQIFLYFGSFNEFFTIKIIRLILD